MKPAVFIPVYNAFGDALECLVSIARHSPGLDVLVIDDASPSGNFEPEIPRTLYGALNLQVIRNETNLGFPGTCNKAFQILAPRDVVILNSDTIVSAGWIDKLSRAALSSSRVGTVTPLTNNGVICSVPGFCEYNDLPAGYAIDTFASLVERCSEREYPELPTCVGFCTYIKREVLDYIGGFDQQSFGSGYGEENDLSCRLRKSGYVDILDDSTFIYHKGERSFKEKGQELRAQNLAILSRKYPDFMPRVQSFIARNPLNAVHRRIALAMLRDLLKQSEKPLVLHILHNGPFRSYGDRLGGTERHVRDIVSKVSSVVHASLVATPQECWFVIHLNGGECRYRLPADSQFLAMFLDLDLFSVIHLHHSRWFNHVELLEGLARKKAVIVSVHDFVLGCPRFHLLTPAGKLCDLHECQASCGIVQRDIDRYRLASSSLLANADKVLAFSDRSVDLLREMVAGEWKAEIVPHGTELRVAKEPPKKIHPPESLLRVAALGGTTYHKGGDLLRRLVKHSQLASGARIEWHIIGESSWEVKGAHVKHHGPYDLDDLPIIVDQIAPHLALFLSRAEETYSLVVDEALACGVPVVVSPRGAPAERVRGNQLGWVLPNLAEGDVLALFTQIVKAPSEYQATRERVAKFSVPSLEGEMEYYSKLYLNYAPISSKELTDAVRLLQDSELTEAATAGTVAQFGGSIVARVVAALDRVGARRQVQSAISRVLPRAVIDKLKELRRASWQS